MRTNLPFLLVFAAILGACNIANSGETTKRPDAEVVSLRQHYAALHETAQKWDEDAYLRSVEIPVFGSSKDNYLWQVFAVFQAPSREFETAVVVLELDGRITFRPVLHSSEVYQVDSIELTDWKLDSKDAVTEFWKSVSNDDARLLGGRTSLFLERVLGETNQPVVWRLSTNMGSADGQHYYIDALTGEALQIVR